VISWIVNLFATESEPARLPRDLSRLDLGVCPGCRGLRAVASLRCSHCDSAAPVVADA
jgi:hypothetical protein